eukprot:XP_011673466.1 PREDICTED: uncharacterized protein LOC105442741 [Strongylocentrotus purpuratus]
MFQNEELEERALMKMFVKISSVMDSENNDVKNAVYQCTDAILKKLCSSEKFTPESIETATLLVCCMQPFKGAASGMLLAVEHAIKQQYYPESTSAFWIRNRMTALLSRIDSLAPTQSYLPLCTVNVYSILRDGRLQSVCNLINESKVEIIAMTETWLEPNGPESPIGVSGHGFVHHPRAGRRGGGTGLLFKDTINARQGHVSDSFF